MIESLYLKSGRPEAPRLRIGLLVDGLDIMRPFAAVIDHLLAADFIDLALVVVHDSEPTPPLPLPAWSAPLPRKVRLALHPGIRPHLLYTLFEKFDRRQNPEASALLDPVDCRLPLAGVPQLSVRPLHKRFVHRFPEEALAQIREHRLDVLLRFGFNILRGEILQAARHGVWSYHHGDNDFYRGGPAHFWEMVERNPVSGVLLQILSEELDAGRVLTKALAPTRSFHSEAANRVAPYATGQTMVIRKLWELHTYGLPHLENHSIPAAPYRGRQKIYRRPSNAQMLRFLAPAAGRIATNRFRPVSPWAHWRLAVRPTATPTVSLDHPTGFRWLEPPPGHAYADPFPYERDGQSWLFFEDFHYRDKRGRLAAARLQADGSLGETVPILERPYHLSYPFLWEQDGELFMIPESGAAGQVQLFRNRRFPDDWVLERVLFEGPAADTTVVQHEGRLWFFVSLTDRPASEQLYLFSAPTLFEAWQYHPANPISLDVRRARCGGAFLQQDGQLIRVAQDGSQRYGYALRFARVLRLNEREYQEEETGNWTPEPLGVRGVHTYNRSARWEFLDGQTTQHPSASA